MGVILFYLNVHIILFLEDKGPRSSIIFDT